MILSVLSGEKNVEEAALEAEMSPAMYYQLEKKALIAMLAALVPGATTDGTPAPRVRQLEEKVTHLEQLRRRTERLLFLTRQVLGPDPTKPRKRGRPKKDPNSMPSGERLSRDSRTAKTTKRETTPSMRMPVGETAP